MEMEMEMEYSSANHQDNSHSTVIRRTANYKPNIWNYDILQQSLITSIYHEDKYKREAGILKEQVSGIFSALKDPLHKLELIDGIHKLALSYYFEDEIDQFFNDNIACMNSTIKYNLSTDQLGSDDLYSAALCFWILRQHGFNVSEDAILQLLDGEEKLMITMDEEASAEVYEASHLALEDECLPDREKQFTIYRNNFLHLNSNNDQEYMQDDIYSAKSRFPLHRSVNWFDARKYMQAEKNPTLLTLSTLSFNIVQVQHQKDLEELLRWWQNLGLSEVLTFTRDRLVESFLLAVGVAYEPQYGSLRKWLTKAIMLIVIFDDIYDIYGSNQELHQFTNAVERWDPKEIQHLPEAINKCFWALYDTANDIDHEIQKEKGWNVSVLPHLKKVWTGFCKALLVEAKWYHKGHTPSLSEYLENGWTSSSGPVLSLHILFGVGQHLTQTMSAFNSSQEIIHHVSMIIRLCNDQGTSKAELERGDAPSSILCHMREANVTEEAARDHIRNIISESWKKINGIFIKSPLAEQKMMRYIVNAARVANFIYQNGDGFGDQDRETRDQVLSCLIQPLPLA